MRLKYEHICINILHISILPKAIKSHRLTYILLSMFLIHRLSVVFPDSRCTLYFPRLVQPMSTHCPLARPTLCPMHRQLIQRSTLTTPTVPCPNPVACDWRVMRDGFHLHWILIEEMLRECCKLCRYFKFKGTMTKWSFHKQTHIQLHTNT